MEARTYETAGGKQLLLQVVLKARAQQAHGDRDEAHANESSGCADLLPSSQRNQIEGRLNQPILDANYRKHGVLLPLGDKIIPTQKR